QHFSGAQSSGDTTQLSSLEVIVGQRLPSFNAPETPPKITGEEKIFIATEDRFMPVELEGEFLPGEEFVVGKGHAEQTILQERGQYWDFIEGGSSRNVCKRICQPLIEQSGMQLGGPTFRGMLDKTRYRMFWKP